MRRYAIFIFIVSLVSYSVSAQNMYSDSGHAGVIYLKPMSEGSPSDAKRGSYVGPHLLGDSITYLLNRFEKAYVYYKASSGPYPVEEMVILKRTIYKKVHEFDDFITKSYIRSLVHREEARKRLMNVMGISLRLLNYDTRKLEKEVKKLEVPTDFERYLNELKFN